MSSRPMKKFSVLVIARLLDCECNAGRTAGLVFGALYKALRVGMGDDLAFWRRYCRDVAVGV